MRFGESFRCESRGVRNQGSGVSGRALFLTPDSRPLIPDPCLLPRRLCPRHSRLDAGNSGHMSKNVVPVEIRTVLPFNAGRAVFIGNEEKVFVIYVDEGVGAAITMFINRTPKERPLTHDLMGHLLAALGAKVERVIINDLKSETYFARLIITAENELFEKKDHRAGRTPERLHRPRHPAGLADLREPRGVGGSRGSQRRAAPARGERRAAGRERGVSWQAAPVHRRRLNFPLTLRA